MFVVPLFVLFCVGNWCIVVCSVLGGFLLLCLMLLLWFDLV